MSVRLSDHYELGVNKIKLLILLKASFLFLIKLTIVDLFNQKESIMVTQHQVNQKQYQTKSEAYLNSAVHAQGD
jgi:hypothetical protein